MESTSGIDIVHVRLASKQNKLFIGNSGNEGP